MRIHDVIGSTAAHLPAIGGSVDLLRGEDRTIGKTYQHAGWARMGDRARVQFIRDLSERYGGDPEMRFHTTRVLRNAGAAPRDNRAQAAAILRYAQSMYYTNEPGEQLQSPWRTIKEGTGDCDDLAMLMASMAESIKLPWKFALGGHKGGKPVRWMEGERLPWGTSWTHIYVYLGWPPFKPTTWAAAEPTIKGLPLGHDVVTMGMPGQARGQGTADIPGTGLSGYGGYLGSAEVRVTDDPPAVGASVAPLPVRVLGAIQWGELGNAVLQAVTIAAVLTWLDRRRR